MTLGDIIKDYRIKHSLSMDAFASLSGISKAYISILEKNEHPNTGEPVAPSIQMYEKAAKGMKMNFNDLFNMVDGNVSLQPDEESGKKNTAFDNIIQIDKQTLPVLGKIACGDPIFMNEECEFYTQAGTKIRADFILVASGDSMINARIYDGDLVFIRSQPIVENGEIAAVAIGDEATLKRFYYYKEELMIILRPENSKYEEIKLRGAELEQVKVLGKAIAFQSNVK